MIKKVFFIGGFKIQSPGILQVKHYSINHMCWSSHCCNPAFPQFAVCLSCSWFLCPQPEKGLGVRPLSCHLGGVRPSRSKNKEKIRIMFLCFKNQKKLNEWYGSMGQRCWLGIASVVPLWSVAAWLNATQRPYSGLMPHSAGTVKKCVHVLRVAEKQMGPHRLY